jgi:hypothetical protein
MKWRMEKVIEIKNEGMEVLDRRKNEGGEKS